MNFRLKIEFCDLGCGGQRERMYPAFSNLDALEFHVREGTPEETLRLEEIRLRSEWRAFPGRQFRLSVHRSSEIPGPITTVCVDPSLLQVHEFVI
jgi:hypothetical protein